MIPPGNGIMHQINLERMSPVIHADRTAWPIPIRCVGTDSHTPHVDALGVIAIGVGGLEAENVMLGRASWMRLPDIVGVELTGKPQPGITATDIVLALTEFLRKEKVVGAYLEFYGDRRFQPDAGRPRNHLQHGSRVRRHRGDVLHRRADHRLPAGSPAATTSRSSSSRPMPSTRGLWADSLKTAQYERVLRFDLSTVVRNMAGPSNPHKRLPTSALAERGIAGKWEEVPGQMPDGAVIIAAITSCTNTSNPRNVIAAGLLARNANARGLDAQAVGEVARWRPARRPCSCTWKKPSCCPNWRSSASASSPSPAPPATACRGALDPKIQQEIIDRDLYATAVLSGNRNFDGRIHPYAKQAFLASPPLVVAYAIAGTIRFDIEKDVLGTDKDGKPVTLKDIWPSDEEIDAIVAQSVKPEQFRKVYEPMFAVKAASGEKVSPLYDWRPQSTYIRRPPYWEGALAGERTLQGHASAGGAAATTSPPTTCRRPTPSCSTAPLASTWRRWACRKRTSTPTPRTAATTSPRSAQPSPIRP